MEASRIVVFVKNAETLKILFFPWNFNDFWSLVGVFSKQDIVKIAFLAITNWIPDVGVRRPARPGVLEAGLGGLERHLGDYCVLLNGLGRFQNALGTFQEAPERESLIFQWFWEVLGGVPRTRQWRRAVCPTP
mgnify:CR=1 FL=1